MHYFHAAEAERCDMVTQELGDIAAGQSSLAGGGDRWAVELFEHDRNYR